MAITVALVEVTPFRLRYLATQDGQAGALATIPNAVGATPDLGTDILGASGPSPLQALIDAGRDGYKSVGPTLTQAEARALLNSDDPTRAVLTNNNVGRAVLSVTGRDAPAVGWAVDVNVAAGQPVIEVRSGAAAATAYVDLHYRHTDDL